MVIDLTPIALALTKASVCPAVSTNTSNIHTPLRTSKRHTCFAIDEGDPAGSITTHGDEEPRGAPVPKIPVLNKVVFR